MRTPILVLASAMLSLVQFAASAQTVAPVPANPPPTNSGPLTDAPVPNVVPERVAPADRAGTTGTTAGPTNNTPFSAAPSGTSGGQTSPALRDTLPNSGPSTPSLSK